MSNIDSVCESSDCMSLTQTIINDLKADLRGEVLQPQDIGYDDARTIWNAMIVKPSFFSPFPDRSSGTGATFTYYGPGANVTATEPDDDFRAAEEAAQGADARIRV